MIARLRCLIVLCLLLLPSLARAQGVTTGPIDEALGRSGQKTGDVYKVSFPRSDLHVSVHGLAIKPGLALGSWAAFLGTDDNAMVMGDLVLLESELNLVIAKLRSSGFDISAVHNHLMEESSRVLYAHYMGHGPAVHLATSLRAALALSKTPLGKPAATTEEAAPAWVKAVEDAVGRKGTFKGGVLSCGVARSDAITMGGTTIPPAAGVAEGINFQAADSGNHLACLAIAEFCLHGSRRPTLEYSFYVATTGDFVLTAEEVNPVISELQGHQISVTALHSHMLTEQPRLFFMHFWSVGTPEAVGAGIKAALSRVAVK